MSLPKPPAFWISAILFLISARFVPANAAVMIHLTFEEMTSKSSAILMGRCVDVRSEWNAEHTAIVTHNVFEVREYYKGNLGSRVTITELGGQVGTWVADFTGMPRFQVGEESLLFVWTGPDGQHQVIGFTQGKFRMERNSQTGDVLLRQTFSSEPMLEPPTHSHSRPTRQLEMPLAIFKQSVLAQINKASGGARQ